MQISGEVNDIILKGYELAKGNKDEFVTAEHLLYGITFVERFINALSKLNGSAVNLRKKLDEYISEYIEEGDVEGPIESYSFQQAIIKASEHAVFSSQKSITMEHLISAIYDLENSYASYYLQEEGIEKRDLLYKLCHEENEDDEYMEEGLISEGDEEINMDEENTKNKGTLLKTLTINLNEIVKNDNSDPLIGRKDILERTIQILCRRNKNNPIHVGEPGVGKTAITLGLARLINKGEVPEKLKNAEIFSLDIGAVLAGTKYRGDFEERIKKVLNEIQTHENPIVYIDEIHNIVGAGSIDGGSLDTSNLLKPYLVSGKVKFIGATTFDEYKKYFEKDKALTRRFQTIEVKETTVEDTIKILNGLKSNYENYHNVKYTEAAIKAAVTLSHKYINDKLDEVDKNKFNILLSHNPTGAQTLKDYEFDLVFSGHVHGGIIRFFNKGLLDPARKFFPKYNKGLYEVGNTQLFVSTGLGNTKFMRINNSPELNLITLKSK